MEDTGPANLDPRESAFVGQVISERYRVGELIASGGMGAVFRGEHLHMRKRVAIKILHAETEGILELAEQFEREAIAGAHISHPNVAIATDFGRLDDGSFFLVQEFLRGVTLAQVLEQGPLAVERAVRIAKQIAGALQAVHAKGIVHRDLKPGNVMLIDGSQDLAKLIDFGFAKVPMDRMSVARADDPLRAGGSRWRDKVFGTIGYLAPEAAEGMDAVDARSDLYALGVIIYEMLTGKRPFEAAKSAELFKLHRTVPPPPFVERAPLVPVPAALESVVMRLLAKDPAARYQTGDEVIAALDRVIAGKPRAFAQRPSADLEDLAIPPVRRARRWWLGAVAALAAAGAIVWLVPAVRERVGLGMASASNGVAPGAPSGPGTAKTVDDLGAAEWTARLLAAPKAMDWKGGAKALGALAELDPKALRAAEVAKAATAVAIGASRAPGADPLASELFQLLAQRFGSEGLELLYAIVEEQPLKHPAAARAATELSRPEVLARATPALRMAIELRDGPCSQKAGHFDGAAADGDARVLRALKYLRGLPCRSEQDPCCFHANDALAKAISLLEARLKKE